MKRIFVVVAVLLLSLLAVCVFRALSLPASTPPPPAVALLTVDAAASAARLGAAVRIATVSHEDRALMDAAAYEQMRSLLASSFPHLHAAHPPEIVGGHSLLYTITGSEPALAPVVLIAHLDVVPVAPGTEGAWTRPPFSGEIADGYVWGRGTLDDKGSLMAICEAAEALLASGFQPRRTLYLAFGHDEEIGGEQGAKQIAALLQSRGVKAAFTLDEGGAVTQGIVPGVARPVATLMAGEKGYVSYSLRLRGEGGHSSTPPAATLIGRLAAAVARLEQNPMPARLTPPVEGMLGAIAPEMDFGARLLMANRWLFEPVILKVLGQGRTTNAVIRTTTAPTMFNAGIKDNVLPEEARAVINFRLLPGDSIAAVEQHIRDTIDDADIELRIEGEFGNEAPPASDPTAPAWALLANAVREVFPEAIVASGLVLGATDNRHYAAVREQGYYFAPFPYRDEDGKRIHGTDERLGVEDYGRMIQFYAQVMRNGAGA